MKRLDPRRHSAQNGQNAVITAPRRLAMKPHARWPGAGATVGLTGRSDAKRGARPLERIAAAIPRPTSAMKRWTSPVGIP